MFVLPFPIGILAFTVRQLKWNLLEQSSPKYGLVNNESCICVCQCAVDGACVRVLVGLHMY